MRIAIVLASAAFIISFMALAWIAGALRVVGLAFVAIGFLAPTEVRPL